MSRYKRPWMHLNLQFITQRIVEIQFRKFIQLCESKRWQSQLIAFLLFQLWVYGQNLCQCRSVNIVRLRWSLVHILYTFSNLKYCSDASGLCCFSLENDHDNRSTIIVLYYTWKVILKYLLAFLFTDKRSFPLILFKTFIIWNVKQNMKVWMNYSSMKLLCIFSETLTV